MVTRARSRKADQKADLGKAIVFLADRSGLKQSELATLAGMSPKAVSSWSRGKSSPGRRAMEAVLTALNCTEDDVEAATTMFREWRLKMHRQAASNLEIKETPGSPRAPASRGASGLPSSGEPSSSDDEHDREVGRTARKLFHLLALAPDRKAPRP